MTLHLGVTPWQLNAPSAASIGEQAAYAEVLVVSALVAVHRSMLAAVAHARAVRSRFAVA